MKKLVETLLELQELELVREEVCIVHRDEAPAKLAQVEEHIASLRETVPEAHLKRYDGHRRTGVAAVREDGGICRGCHLNVPVGDLHRMRRGEMEWLCPNCGRFLLLSSEDS